MGLFSRKKKGNIKTPFGYINEFTGENDLPDALPTLRAMAYYYTYRVKNREYSYYIDKKIIALDTKKEYMDSRFRMAMNYFDGFMVRADKIEGSRYFIEWMDSQFLKDSSFGSMLRALKDYFYYGFKDYGYLLEMSMRRIEQDIKNNAEPVGMCIYKSIIPLWQYSKLVEILGIGQRNATAYFEFLKDNLYLPEAELMLEIIYEEEGMPSYYSGDRHYLKCETFAKEGNILAIAYILERWLCIYNNTQDEGKISENARYKAEYERISAQYKQLQKNLSHSESLALKEQTDKMLLAYSEVFKGTFEIFPEDFPFKVKEDSLLFHAQRFTKCYDSFMSKYVRDEKLEKEAIESGEFLLKEKNPYGMYMVLLFKSNFPYVHYWERSTKEIYNELCEMRFAPALALGKEVTKENRALLLELLLNEELNKEEADRYYDLAVKEYAKSNWYEAIFNISQAQHFGKEIPHQLTKEIVRNAYNEANKVVKGKPGSMNRDRAKATLRIAAESFCEPRACLTYAVLLNNDENICSAAFQYLKLAEKYSSYSYVTDGPVSEEFRNIVAGNIAKAVENPDPR